MLLKLEGSAINLWNTMMHIAYASTNHNYCYYYIREHSKLAYMHLTRQLLNSLTFDY